MSRSRILTIVLAFDAAVVAFLAALISRSLR
jgi:hypothetical protein